MQRRRGSVLFPVMAGIGGLVLGASIALLVLHGATSEWVEAAGTWVGAVGTVFALLWAVRTFRADQADRELSRSVALEERGRKAAEQEENLFKEAELVTLRVKGVISDGSEPDLTLRVVQITITNDAPTPVRINSVSFRGPLKEQSPMPRDVRLEHSGSELFQVRVDPIPVTAVEMNSLAVPRFEAEMTYALHGRLWTTTTAEGARPQLAER